MALHPRRSINPLPPLTMSGCWNSREVILIHITMLNVEFSWRLGIFMACILGETWPLEGPVLGAQEMKEGFLLRQMVMFWFYGFRWHASGHPLLINLLVWRYHGSSWSKRSLETTSPNRYPFQFSIYLVFRCFLIYRFSGSVWDLCNSLVHSPPFPCGIECFLASSPSTSFSLGCFCPFSSGFGVSLLFSPLMRSTLL